MFHLYKYKCHNQSIYSLRVVKEAGSSREHLDVELAKDASKNIESIERTLASLLKKGYIIKVGGGRSTAYVKVDKCFDTKKAQGYFK